MSFFMDLNEQRQCVYGNERENKRIVKNYIMNEASALLADTRCDSNSLGIDIMKESRRIKKQS